nr:hypothetical protein [Tanacetum cinerariifolium]
MLVHQEARQDRANIIKTSALPHDSTPRVTSLAADEASMQQQLNELTDLCTRLQRQQLEMANKIVAQDLEIFNLKARIKFLEDKAGGGVEPSGEDATIKGRSLETGEEEGVKRSTKRGSNDTEELVNVHTSLDTANILNSRVQVVSVPPAVEVSTIGIPTGSGMVPTASPIFTTASVVTPYSRRQAREMEEQMAREDQRRSEQIAREAEIARIHAEEELQMMIDGLGRSNEMIAKHLHEYEQAAAELTIGEKIELINELVKYQDHHSKILKYQAQQKQESPKKMKTLEEVSQEDLKERTQLVPVEERVYWKIIRLGGSTTVYHLFVDMLKHFDREDLIQLWTLVKETLSIRQATSYKEKELWVELKRLFEPDVED